MPDPFYLELEVDLPADVSSEVLQERLEREAGHLRRLLDEAVPEGTDGEEAARGRQPRQARSGGADPVRARDPAWLARLNHPTTPVGPSFLHQGSYWEQRRNSRICERKEERERLLRQQQDQEAKPFKASPVPASVLAPRFQAMQAAEAARRSSSLERGSGDGATPKWRPASAERGRPPPTVPVEERPAPFRARPVPWSVGAPLYEQMNKEEQRSREERIREHSRQMLRSSSLPPRLEGLRRRAAEEAGKATKPATSPQAVRALHDMPLLRRSHSGVMGAAVAAAESLARDLSASAAAARPSSAAAKPQGAAAGPGTPGAPRQGRVARAQTPPPQRRAQSADPRAAQTLGTTEVPDFAALHERERQRLERRKHQNRLMTQPAPFAFSTPVRSRARQPLMVKDPTADWRFKRPRSARPASAGASAKGSEEGGAFPVSALRRPSVAVPARTTEKMVQWQQHIANALQERRESEWQRQHQLEKAREVSSVMKLRVQQAVGPAEALEEKIERIVSDKRQSTQRVMRNQLLHLSRIKERVNRRPLLMEQADSLVRARRRALFRVRSTLEAAGVRDVDSHFQDDELDELERGQGTEDATYYY